MAGWRGRLYLSEDLFLRDLSLVLGAAVEGDPDGLSGVGLEFEFLAGAEQVHELFDELLVLFH